MNTFLFSLIQNGWNTEERYIPVCITFESFQEILYNKHWNFCPLAFVLRRPYAAVSWWTRIHEQYQCPCHRLALNLMLIDSVCAPDHWLYPCYWHDCFQLRRDTAKDNDFTQNTLIQLDSNYLCSFHCLFTKWAFRWTHDGWKKQIVFGVIGNVRFF